MRRPPEPSNSVAAASPIDGARIVVIGVNFAPELTGIGPYTTDLCLQLASTGAEVCVVTGMPHYPTWSLPEPYRRRLRATESDGPLKVCRVRHYVPRSQNLPRRAAFEASFAAASYLEARGRGADVVLAVTPNIGTVPVAASLARRNRAPFGVVVQDIVGKAATQSGVRIGRMMAGVVAMLEGRWLRSADAIGVVSRDFVAPLLAAGVAKDRISYVPNYTHVTLADRSRAEARARLGWEAIRFYVVHTGNMGLKQDLGNVVAAARLAEQRAPWIHFVLIGDGSDRRTIEARAAGIRSIHVYPPLSDERYPLALAAADVLLVNERATVKDMSLPSKLTSYFAAARPVVAATARESATAREIERSAAGVVVAPGDPYALFAEIEQLAGDPFRLERLAANGVRYARQHLGQNEGRARLLRFVETLASGSMAREIRC